MRRSLRSSRRCGVVSRPSGRQWLLWLSLIVSLPSSGCDSLQKKHDAPVMAEAPRRIERPELDEDEQQYVDGRGSKTEPTGRVKVASKEDDGTDITQVRMAIASNQWDNYVDDTAIFNSQVAAMVNGAPILNGEMLDRVGGSLNNVRETMKIMAKDPSKLQPGQPAPTPEDYARFREGVIQQSIADMIKKKLLVERLKAGMKPEQIKLMNGHIDDLFDREAANLKKALGVTTKTELELAMNKQGTTLQSWKDNLALDALSRECMNLKSDKPDPIERPDMIGYYQTHPETFRFPARVKWEQIQVHAADYDKKDARKKMAQAMAELKQGVPFAKVARKYSDGGNAKDGGAWDWMEKGNLADTELEEMLFTMPVNKLSEIHESKDSLSIVRVVERREAGRKPFKEVQSEVHAVLLKEQNDRRSQKFFKELFSQAVIETKYSLPQFVEDE